MRWNSYTILVVVGFQVLGCGGRVELIGRSQVGSIHVSPQEPEASRQPPQEPEPPRQPTPKSGPSRLPAHLVLEEIEFREPSGNQVLDAEEEGTLYLKIRNDGLGPAKLAIRLTPLGSVEHLEFARYQTQGELPKQGSRTIEIVLRAGLKVADGMRELKVEIVDEYTQAARPDTLSFKTRRVEPPVFLIVMQGYDDGKDVFSGNRPDGRMEAGEVIKVTANVQNTGGDAEGVVATVEYPDDISFYRNLLKGDENNRFVWDEMATGDQRSLEFYFRIPHQFSQKGIDFTLKIAEARGFSAEKVLSLGVE